MGVGEAKQDSRMLEAAQEQLGTIAGQRPNIRRARKSIAAFKLREGMPVGLTVTLRSERAYEFLDRLLSVAIPRIRDFRGLKSTSFDGRGNYTIGLREQIIFPEIDYDAVDQVRGLDVTITTTAKTDGEAYALLEAFGMPFARDGRGPALPTARSPAPARHRRTRQPGTHFRGERGLMAKTSQRVSQARGSKFKTREYTRCRKCGRARSVYKKFGLCRICLRDLAHNGYIPGMTKSSW